MKRDVSESKDLCCPDSHFNVLVHSQPRPVAVLVEKLWKKKSSVHYDLVIRATGRDELVEHWAAKEPNISPQEPVETKNRAKC